MLKKNLWVLICLAAGQLSFSEERVISLGKMEPFWRYSAALGPFHEVGQALETIPDYICGGAFPYAKRNTGKEIPFCDHISMVRILGGFNDAKDPSIRERDLAWRDDEGNIQYRMDLLAPRLRPYLDAGYTDFTIVLDNVPWCLPKVPKAVGLGQYMPPENVEEWHGLVKALCEELVEILGFETANRLRFRIGTENNQINRFGGTQEEYIRHYDAAAAAVKSILPDAKFGAFNLAGANVAAFQKGGVYNVDLLELADHCVNGTNTWNGGQGVPFDWVAFSRYHRVDTDPAANARGCEEVWNEFEKRFPQLEGVSREIHEFDIAPWGETGKGDAFVSEEYGALGAAVTAQVMFRLRQAGIDKLWHWEMTDAFRERSSQLRKLFTGHAWLLCVLEHTLGSETFLLEPEVPSAQGLNALALAAVGTEDLIFVISAYQPEEGIKSTPEEISFRLPDSFRGVSELRFVSLNNTTAAHDTIRAQLSENGLLKQTFVKRPTRTGSVREMGEGRAAEEFIGDRLPLYEKMWIDSMTLRPLPEEKGRLSRTGLTIEVTPPEVLVIRAKFN